MQVEISIQQGSPDPLLRADVERRLSFALARLSGRVHAVDVRLADVNGPRGGVDKRCRLQLSLRQLEPIVVTAVEVDYRTAVDRAARKAERALARRLERTRAGRRRSAARGSAA